MKMIVPSESLVQRRYSMEDWLVLELLPNLPNLIQRCRKSSGRFLTLHKRRRKKLLTRRLSKNHALLDDISHGVIQHVLNECNDWAFNAFLLENVSGGRSLTTMSLHLFHWYGLIDYFKLDAAHVWKLFSLIEEGYHSTNPYHNAIHATDVIQAMHCFLQEEQIKKYLTPLEIMAALLSAIAHDLDHPGVNQPFLIATSNHLAALYGNMSVLENHHWRSAIGCLIDSGVADQLSLVKGDLEEQMRSLILATDIDRHQEFLLKFQKYIDEDSLDLTKFEDRHFMLQIALKCADISNPTRPWDISRKWSFKVCEEFFRQGDYERKLNMSITPLCDRFNQSVPKIQIGFLRFVVVPLFSEWHQFHQSKLSSQMMRHLAQNQLNWEYMESLDLGAVSGKFESAISDESDVIVDSTSIEKSETESENAGFVHLMERVELPIVCNSRRHSVPANLLSKKAISYFGRNNLSLCEQQSAMLLTPKFGSEASIYPLTNEDLCNKDENGNEKPLSIENLLPDCTILSIRRNSDVAKHPSEENLEQMNTKFLKRQQTYPSISPNIIHCPLLQSLDDYDDIENEGSSNELPVSDRRSNVSFNVPKIMISSSGSLKNFKKCDFSDNKQSLFTEKENVDPQREESFPRRASAPVTCVIIDEEMSVNTKCCLSAGGEDCHTNTTSSNIRRGSMPIDIYHYCQDTLTKPEEKSETDTFIVQLPISSWKMLRRESAPSILSDRVLSRHVSLNGKSSRRLKHFSRRSSGGVERADITFDSSKRRGSLPLEVLAGRIL